MQMKLIFLVLFFIFHQSVFAQEKSQIDWEKLDTISDVDVYFSELAKLQKEKISKRDQGILYSKRAIKFNALGKYDKALLEVNKALKLLEKSTYYDVKADLYRSKGNVYYYLRDSKKAIYNYKIGVKLAQQANLKKLEGMILSNLGAIEVEENRFLNAENYLKESIQCYKKVNEEFSRHGLLAYRLLATLYEKSGDKKKAKKSFLKVIDLCESKNDSVVLASALNYYAVYLRNVNLHDSSLFYFNRAYKIQKALGNRSGLIAIQLERNLALVAQGKFEEAYFAMRAADSMRQIEFNVQLKDAVAESESKYQNDLLRQKNRLIELEKGEEQQKRMIAEQRRNTIIIYFILSLLIVTLSFVVYFLRQKRSKIEFERKKAEELVAALIEGEEREKVRIARELHDGIVQDLSIIHRNINQQIESGRTDLNLVQQNSIELKKIINEVRNISHQLMPLALRELGLIAGMQDMVAKALENTGIEIEIDIVGLKERLPLKIEVSLFRIAQELITNIVKHSNAKMVSILLSERNGFVTLIIEDDGNGFDASKKSNGIGLKNIDGRLSMMNGKLKYDSKENGGTVVIIHIPIK